MQQRHLSVIKTNVETIIKTTPAPTTAATSGAVPAVL
jgi:hypothetical protein